MLKMGRSILATVILCALFGAPAAHAQTAGGIRRDSAEIEFYGGWYFRDDIAGNSADDATFGLRGGYNFSPHVGWQIAAGYFNPSVPGVDLTTWLADVDVVWHVNPDSRAVFDVSGGAGWARSEWDFKGPPTASSDASSGSLNVALGGQLFATDRFYIRPEVRARWFANDKVSDDIEWEATIAFGWELGGT